MEDLDKIIFDLWYNTTFSQRFIRLSHFPSWRKKQSAHETKQFFYSRRAILGGL